MSPLPTKLVDRWRNRAEPATGESLLYWHILLHDQPDAVKLAELAQQQLKPFSDGLHFTPLNWLHVTVAIAGPASEISRDATETMASEATRFLAEVPSCGVSLSRIIYHQEAIMLAVEPAEVLTPVLSAVQKATLAATGSEGTVHQPWTPHMTLAYSTRDQDAEPIIAALGRRLTPCEVTIEKVSLVAQNGPERLWDWHVLSRSPLSPSYRPLRNL